MDSYQGYEVEIMRKGISMIEIIVSIAIAGIMLALLTMILSSSAREYNREASMLYGSSTARMVQLEIEDSIKEASYATCSFDNIDFGKAVGVYKRLIYIVPLKSGTLPYLLVLKDNNPDSKELHRVYFSNDLNSSVKVNTWRQQGLTMINKDTLSFEELTPEENSLLNTQLDSMLHRDFYSGLTRLSAPPSSGMAIDGAQDYYKINSLGTYCASVNNDNGEELVYLENINYQSYSALKSDGDNLVMNGIDDIEINQEGHESFNIKIRCDGTEYESHVFMKSYSRGGGLEKK